MDINIYGIKLLKLKHVNLFTPYTPFHLVDITQIKDNLPNTINYNSVLIRYDRKKAQHTKPSAITPVCLSVCYCLLALIIIFQFLYSETTTRILCFIHFLLITIYIVNKNKLFSFSIFIFFPVVG